LEDIVYQLDYNLHQYAEKVYGEPLTKFYQEGNAIGIQFDGKEYESLSGGEKQKLDVLIQLSLRDLIIQTSGIEANLVVFDEIFDALDQTGCESLLNVITELGLTVYSITHRKELNIPYDKRLVVVKEENGIAHLEIG
jgi:DNA repair exonuclease SbcCD ATPase subunit